MKLERSWDCHGKPGVQVSGQPLKNIYDALVLDL